LSQDAGALDEFARNPVIFITFNYDRYLEHRMIRGLVARYNVLPHEAWTALASKIIHVHGSLGDLPEKLFLGTARGQIVPFGAAEDPGYYTLRIALPIAEQAIRCARAADHRMVGITPNDPGRIGKF
jgi:hypothetical protein